MKLACLLALLPIVAGASILAPRDGPAPVVTEIATFKTSVTSFSKQIPIPGGYRLVGAINPGTISGKISGTIQGGTSAPSFVNNATQIIADIEIYGITDDGYPFFIAETGTGLNGANPFYNHEMIQIGGEYAYLASTSLLDALVSINTPSGGADISGTIYTLTDP
ncbi:MAG: hypothetical protein CYPHOPRED_002192 [Cyphobasidiales sp. Tagirdzhanova-0007]|nr:MAG: hypothetical protein CYPHOPRED_002192 [Cyphobasidiales sp. Tagirdzhanova-0007]